jgi:cell division protein FtsB
VKNRKVLMFLMAFVLTLGTFVTFSSTVDAASKSSLEKQVKDLKAENSKLKKQVSSKDKEIKDLKSKVSSRDKEIKKQKGNVASKDKEIKSLKSTISSKDKEIKSQKDKVASRDKEIKSLKAKVIQPLDAKLSYLGNTKSGNTTISSKSVPVLVNYNGVPYAPVQLLGSMYNVGTSYNSKVKTWYLGEGTNGVYMSDVFEEPYHQTGSSYTNEDWALKTGGNKYSKGYAFYVANDNESNVYDFNLQGKYSSISGMLGLQDGGQIPGHIAFYGDGKLIKEYNFNAGDLPINMSISVKGVKKLEIKTDSKAVWYDNYFVLANMKLK